MSKSILWLSAAGALALVLGACEVNDAEFPVSEPPVSELADPEVPFERSCAAENVLADMLARDPDMATRMLEIEEHTARFEKLAFATSGGTTIIPVVVHVVYNGSTQNISDAQIQSQIDVLNADFRRTNADADGTWSQAADTNVEFCWVGTSRTSTTKTSFGTNDSIKFTSQGGHDVYDSSQYLNIWVGNIGGGILGYAQFPGGSASTDGVVIDYRYFGTTGTATAPFDLGRTATHEVGHWLNLRHIWGDGACGVDDFVSDTPTSDAANFGCEVGHISCSTVDMVQNYMDYSDDSCMNLFTQGQKTRMQALFTGARSGLVTATCDPVDLGNPPPPPPPPSSELQNGVPVTGLTGASGSDTFFTIDVPAGASNLSFQMSGGSGDADLYVKFGSAPTSSSYDCRPYTSGNNENCNFAAPSAGTYYVMIHGYSSYSGVSLVASYSTGGGGTCTPYTNTISNISGAKNSETRYTETVPACATTLTVTISGGSGDADLYVRYGSDPTTTTYDCRPYKAGNNETCTFTPPTAGDYHLMLRGYSAYSGVTLETSYQ